jgi:hypothetical protein
MLMIILEESQNNKTNLLCCFINFRKYFDTVPMNNLWNRLEELKVPLELRDVAIIIYENIISKFRNTKEWSKKLIVI